MGADHCGAEDCPAAVFHGDDAGRAEGRVLLEGGLDLAHFNSDSRDLDLMIGSSAVPQPSGVIDLHQVTGAIEALSVVFEEASGGFLRISRISSGNSVPSYCELTSRARDRLSGVVQQ